MLSSVTFDFGSSELAIDLDGTDSAMATVNNGMIETSINGTLTGDTPYTTDVYTITVTGGDGGHVIDLSGLQPADFNYLMISSLITTGSGHDVITGSGMMDDIQAGGGNDTVNGGGGNDNIDGGSEADVLSGDADWDYIFGGDGDDELWSGSGVPDGGIASLDGGPDADTLDGELDDDQPVDPETPAPDPPIEDEPDPPTEEEPDPPTEECGHDVESGDFGEEPLADPDELITIEEYAAQDPSDESCADKPVMILRPIGMGETDIFGLLDIGTTLDRTAGDSSPLRVSPGQKLDFATLVRDYEFTYKVVNGKAVDARYVVPLTGAAYKVSITLTNARFSDGARTTTQTVTKILQKGTQENVTTTFISSPVSITVDPQWDESSPVIVNINVDDESVISNGLKTILATKYDTSQVTNASVRDEDASASITMESAKNVPLPTTMTGLTQRNQNQVLQTLYSSQPNLQTEIRYEFGNDLNGASVDAANYGGLIVNESFTPWNTNIKIAWMQPGRVQEARTALGNQNATAKDIINWWISKENLHKTGSFVINGSSGDSADTIVDNYAIAGLVYSIGNNLLDNNTRDIIFDTTQTYSIANQQIGSTMTVVLNATWKPAASGGKVTSYGQRIFIQ